METKRERDSAASDRPAGVDADGDVVLAPIGEWTAAEQAWIAVEPGDA